MRLKLSIPWMMKTWHGCAPDYIRDVCHGRCCRHGENGTATVALTVGESVHARRCGHVVAGGLLSAARCPWQAEDHLCTRHHTDGNKEPLGCMISPLYINSKMTVVVRHRYIMLPCYGDGKLRTFEAFRKGFDVLFGEAEADRLCGLLGELGSVNGHDAIYGDADDEVVEQVLLLQSLRSA